MASMLTAAYHTLGCKVNQCETEGIRASLERLGFVTAPFGSRADVYIINTCCVTSTAESKSRSAVRRARRANPDGFVVVTGCCAELDPAAVARDCDADLMIGNTDKDSISERVAARFASALPERATLSRKVRPRLRTRAMVKAQDGCDHFCSYCVVPFARRGMRSRPPDEVLAEIRSLADFGYREIVLTGIRLGAYESDGKRLPDLVRDARTVSGVERIRLSSVEPWEVDDSLLDSMDHPHVCRHLHIPLQSGDDSVLELMNRPYSSEDYTRTVARARERIPGIGITTDVIAGFPGETEDAFANTCRVIDEISFARLHVFRYSARPRTAAAGMDGQVDANTKRQRAHVLSELGRLGAIRFGTAHIGKTLDVLVESRASAAEHLTGFADNYLEVRFRGDGRLVGRVVPVRIERVCEDLRCEGVGLHIL